METTENVHVRRKRYNGQYPKKYNEKYKELEPEKYAEDVSHIIESGRTPAGTHISIMVKEIMEILKIKPGETGLDATLGYGGHTQEMLKLLEGKGKLYATDVDAAESEKTKKRLESLGYGSEILTIKNENFANVDKISDCGEKFDFVMADLGVSSMQIDNPARGFTFKADGPLDLRLNQAKGITAAERLKELSQAEIEGMLSENSDEPYANQIAKAIDKAKKSGVKIETTKQLFRIIAEALYFVPTEERKDAVKKSCQRTFQALRIDINNELQSLYDFLDKLPGALAQGGRVAILTFHSGEDRLVKKAFKMFYGEGVYSSISDEVIRPTVEECYINPRAHSAKLRWAVKA